VPEEAEAGVAEVPAVPEEERAVTGAEAAKPEARVVSVQAGEKAVAEGPEEGKGQEEAPVKGAREGPGSGVGSSAASARRRPTQPE
jgi:hypothetical protein